MLEKLDYLCPRKFKIIMRNTKQDSTAAVSRFGRDKRVRTVSAERVERSPRPRREAADEGRTMRRERYDAGANRASFNPNFTEDNRLRGRGDGYAEKSYSRGGESREEGGRSGFKPKFGGPKYADRPKSNGGFGGRAKQGGYKQSGYKQGGYSKPSYDRSENDGEFRRDSGARGGYKGRSDNRAEGGEFGPRKEFGGRNEFGGRGGFKGRGEYKPKGGFKDKRSYRGDERPKSYPKYNPAKQVGEMRLNRFLAQSGLCSRREADDYIQAGLVTVNGVIVSELGTKVLPTDEVKFNDERVQGEKKVYLVLNKPKGYVTSLEDPHADKTVMDLVKNACSERIYPVGRLDKNSLGLLIFTNDGDVTRQLTHPSLEKKKIYQVTLDKPLTRADMERITEGLTLEDGEIFADEVAYASENKKEVGIEIHSGRNRIVRRIFEHLGYAVLKLDRVYYAGITKKNLKRGAWRFLTNEEVDRLKSGRYE